MARLTKEQARQIIREELDRVGLPNLSAFQVEAGARPGAESLEWWHENTPHNERSETRRNQAYLRAYGRIAGEMPMYAGGLLLQKKRLWMDRSVISRCERDGYLYFEPGRNPSFAMTDTGREWLHSGEPEI